MHVALIVDAERLTHEQATINRLCVGLIGEAVQLTRIIPDTFTSYAVDEGEARMALAPRIPTTMKVLPWMRGERANRVMESMEKGPPDAFYAIGAEAWTLGRDLARRFDRPLALDVWSATQLRRLPRGRSASMVAAYIAPTRAIASALRERVDPGLVCHVPLGVGVPRGPRQVLADPGRGIAVAIIGGGRDVPAYRALLGGLSRVVRDMPQLQAVIELAGPAEHEIWRTARRLELLQNLSGISDAARHRGLITRCDVLLMPERYGEVRSLLLEAMAYGMPVVASRDPFLDILVDGETACLVDEADAERWARQLGRLLTEPERARAIGAAGRERIAQEHRSSDQVLRLLDTLVRLTTGGSYPFQTPD